ncbi:hypothetical protein XIS1_490008 [Xenorhabdus innexi]|uniref:Uncharacterized protein n=1 Tax=Xenorhabdus innexi TaxID=290109 RepID=A0A1N6MYW5_9GAMM|nr:hypothetical protein XIS1_490008 [Xenorhabdus innexi]
MVYNVALNFLAWVFYSIISAMLAKEVIIAHFIARDMLCEIIPKFESMVIIFTINELKEKMIFFISSFTSLLMNSLGVLSSSSIIMILPI